MAKHLVKLSKFGGQFRITIPRKVIEIVEWDDVEFVMVEGVPCGGIWIRRFIDGESLKGKRKGASSGED